MSLGSWLLAGALVMVGAAAGLLAGFLLVWGVLEVTFTPVV